MGDWTISVLGFYPRYWWGLEKSVFWDFDWSMTRDWWKCASLSSFTWKHEHMNMMKGKVEQQSVSKRGGLSRGLIYMETCREGLKTNWSLKRGGLSRGLIHTETWTKGKVEDKVVPKKGWSFQGAHLHGNMKGKVEDKVVFKEAWSFTSVSTVL